MEKKLKVEVPEVGMGFWDDKSRHMVILNGSLYFGYWRHYWLVKTEELEVGEGSLRAKMGECLFTFDQEGCSLGRGKDQIKFKPMDDQSKESIKKRVRTGGTEIHQEESSFGPWTWFEEDKLEGNYFVGPEDGGALISKERVNLYQLCKHKGGILGRGIIGGVGNDLNLFVNTLKLTPERLKEALEGIERIQKNHFPGKRLKVKFRIDNTFG